MTVEEKFEVAKLLLRHCTQGLVACGVEGVAVTVIVTAREPADDPTMALVTSLATRNQLRPLLANWIVDTLVAEGLDAATVGAEAAAEADRFFGRHSGGRRPAK